MLTGMDLVYSSLVAIFVCLCANRLFGRLRGLWAIGQFAAALIASASTGALLSNALMFGIVMMLSSVVGMTRGLLIAVLAAMAAIAAVWWMRVAARR
jgi:hypothetical protein